MIGRLVEDGIFLGRVAWFYYRAPQMHASQGIGFVQTHDLSKRDRAKWAWRKASGQA